SDFAGFEHAAIGLHPPRRMKSAVVTFPTSATTRRSCPWGGGGKSPRYRAAAACSKRAQTQAGIELYVPLTCRLGSTTAKRAGAAWAAPPNSGSRALADPAPHCIGGVAFITRRNAIAAGLCERRRSPHPPRVVWVDRAHLRGRL